MGASLQSSGKAANKRRSYRPMAEINVTPFVDVVLVLLIVFMVAAPLMTAGIPVDLPQSEATPIAKTEEPLILTVDAQGILYIQESAIDLPDLIDRLRAVSAEKPETVLYIRGDKSIAYGQVMDVMGRINAAGFRNVALVTEIK